MEFNVAPAGSPIALAPLIPIVPALSAALLLIVGKRLGRFAAHVAITAVGYSAVASTLVFLQLRAGDEQRRFVTTVATWLNAGPLTVDWALLLDPLSAVMLLLVTWVGLLIHIYSVGYMHGDERYPRFFAYLNLFAASMLVLVTGSSMLTLFVGWELVGLCSYLLIGFWFENREYASAAKKAFVVNRVGDVGFMVAMFVTFAAVGSLAFSEVLGQAATLGAGTATAVGLLLLVAATGKSAQIPLFVWLPDAMAGPTPVSALIHAATMVTAGVYLIARASPIYATVSGVGLVVAWVGVLTALLGALIACGQNDSKKILAYSTVSQLGYMFVGVGLGAQVAGIFHLLTHGFFKALLFLAAGSVMHAMASDTDVWRMGGLRGLMPITFATSATAWLAISGIPPFSGFFSKEEILAAALDTPGAQAIWLIGLIVAAITAFYMSRWFFLLFLGEPRWDHHQVHPHESPPSMTLPLVLLAVGATFGGLINLNPESGFLHHWLEPSVVPYAGEAPFLPHALAQVLAVLAGASGIVVAWSMYVRRAPVPAPATGIRALAANRFYVDELYERIIAWPGLALSRGLALFDRRGIDGLVNGIARATGALAGVGRRLQSGFVRSYALAVLVGTVLVVVLFLGGVAIGGGR
jgi:NADH-quinone oxidoreductase subunit L